MKTFLSILLCGSHCFSDPGIMVEIDTFFEQIANDAISDGNITIDGEQIG